MPKCNLAALFLIVTVVTELGKRNKSTLQASLHQSQRCEPCPALHI